MRILLVSTWFPYPPDNGSKIRAFEILQGLARRHSVELVTFFKPGEEPRTDWAPCPAHAVPEPIPDARFSARTKAWFSRWPRHLYARQSEEAKRLLAERASCFCPDVLLAIEQPAALHALGLRGFPKAMDLLQLTEMKDCTSPHRGMMRSLRGRMTWWKFVGFVRMLVRALDWIFLPTEQEKRLLRSAAGSVHHASVVPNGVDPNKWRPRDLPVQPHTLIYPGSPTFPFNWEAVTHFCERILPLIQRELPQIRFDITGRFETRHVDWLRGREGVRLAGYVDDMPSFLAAHSACVVPLLSGGGSRIKILEALATGVPVVSSSKGAEGLDLKEGQEILLADTPDSFARSVLRLFQEEGLNASLSTRGRQRVVSDYSWSKIVTTLSGHLEKLVDVHHRPPCGCSSSDPRRGGPMWPPSSEQEVRPTKFGP